MNLIEVWFFLLVFSGLISGAIFNGLEYGLFGALVGGILGAIGGFILHVLIMLSIFKLAKISGKISDKTKN